MKSRKILVPFISISRIVRGEMCLKASEGRRVTRNDLIQGQMS